MEPIDEDERSPELRRLDDENDRMWERALGADPREHVLPITEETRRRAAQAVAGLAGQKHPEVPAERVGKPRRDRHGWLADRREGNSF